MPAVLRAAKESGQIFERSMNIAHNLVFGILNADSLTLLHLASDLHGFQCWG